MNKKRIMEILYEKKIIMAAILGILFCQFPAYASETDEINLYAAPYGSDIYGNGTEYFPYKTVEKINEKAKSLIKTGTKKDINLVFREGEYVLKDTVKFNSLEQRKYEGTITYMAYRGEKVSFLGATDGHKWERAGDGIYKIKVESEVNILFEKGEAARKARFPNRGEKRSDGYLTATGNGNDRELIFSEGDFPKVENQTDLQIYLWAGGEKMVYALDNPGVTVDYNEHKVTLKNTTTNNVSVIAGSRYYMQNALEFLDEPGEMYYSSLESAVYYMPYDEASLESIYIPNLETAFEITGRNDSAIRNISVEGIELKYFDANKSSAANVIRIDYGDNIKIKDCYIHSSGGTGIFANYTEKSEFLENKLENLGGEGIRVQFSKNADNKGNNLIKDNYVKKVGIYDADSSGISVIKTSSNSIINNTVSDVPRAAINIGTGSCQVWNLLKEETVIDGVTVTRENAKEYLTCNDNIVRYNDLSDSMKETNDGGVIYTWGIGYDNDISFNYIHDSVTDFSFAYGGIYIDDDCSKTTVTNNFIRDLHTGDGSMVNVIIVKGQENVVTNNFIIDCTPTNGIIEVCAQAGAGPVGNAVFKNNVAFNSGNIMYGFYSYEQNPSNPLNIKFKECDRNIFYSNGEELKVTVRQEDGKYISLANQDLWRDVFGHDKNTSFESPVFADIYSNDYRLKNDTTANELGISAIDISLCGVTENYRFESNGELDRIYIKGNGQAELFLKPGENTVLETIAKMSDGVVKKDARVSFYSSDRSVAEVDKCGKITAKAVGKATVTAVAQLNGKAVTNELYIIVK